MTYSARTGFAAVTRILLVALSAGIAATGCFTLGQGIRGSGQVTSEQRQVSGFSEVAVTNQGDLEIVIGDDEGLLITAEANLLPHIRSEVSGGKLVIGTDRGVSLRPTKPIRYTLTVRALEGVEATSSGDIRADRLEAARFSIRGTSSGDIKIGELVTDELTVRQSSSGDVAISRGRADRLDLDLTSSGDFDGRGLECREADVTLSSSGDARIAVQERLRARLSSSGDLHYRGNPQVDASESSSGKVRRN